MLKYAFWTLCFLSFLTSIETCGQMANARVIGGTSAEYPWFAIITYIESLSRNSLHLCGGSIITRKDVLTAAHCLVINGIFIKIPARRLAVYLGVSNLCLKQGQGKKVLVSKTILHPQYVGKLLWNDIGIIVLEEEVDFTPICLPQPRSKLPSTAEVIGMGYINSMSKLKPCTLQKANLNVINNSKCKRYIGERAEFSKSIICAGNLKEQKDSCSGDSGGALQQLGANKLFTIYGITSFGIGCNIFPYAAYTDVRKFITWIKENVEYEISN